MLMVNQLSGFGSGSAAAAVPATVTYITSTQSTSALTTYTFSNISIGSANTSRRVIVAATGRAGLGSRQISTVTLDGVTMNRVLQANTAVTASCAGIFELNKDTGTTGNVVVTWSAGANVTHVSIYTATGTGHTILAGLANGATSNPASDTSTVSTNVLAGDTVIAVATHSESGISAFTWTGLTKDVDFYRGSAPVYYYSSASLLMTVAENPRVISVQTNTGDINGRAAVSAIIR